MTDQDNIQGLAAYAQSLSKTSNTAAQPPTQTPSPQVQTASTPNDNVQGLASYAQSLSSNASGTKTDQPGQPEEGGFMHTLKQALFLAPQDPKTEVDAGSINRGAPFDPSTQTLFDPAKPGTMGAGAVKGLAETMAGTSRLAQKGVEKVTGQAPSGKGVFGEAPSNPAEFEAHGGQEWTGKAVENVMEYMSGDEALKALTIPEKLQKLAAVAKFMEQHPYVAKMIGSSAKNAAIAGTQTAAHGDDFSSGAITGAVSGPVAETIGTGLNKLGSSIASKVAGNATAQAADEFGVPLSVGQKTASPVTQKVESVLQKIPFGRAPFTQLGSDQNTAIKNAANEIADSIATKTGSSSTQTGEGIQNAINEAKNTAGKSYAAAQQQISDAGAAQLPIPLKGTISDTAQKMLDNIQLPDEFSAGVKDVQGRQAAVDVLKNLANDTAEDGTPRSMTWEQARRLKSQLFDLANSGDSNVGTGAIKQMTGALDKSMQDTLVGAGKGDLADQFSQASNHYRSINDALDTSIVKRLSSSDPIDVGKFLVNNVSPNTINTLKQVAPNQMPQIQRGVWEELFNRALNNPDGVVAGKTLQKEFQKLGPETASALWNPAQLQKINRFVDMVGKTGLTGGKNSIGSIAAMSAAGGAGGAELATNPSALKGILLHAKTAGGVLVGSRMLANLMASPNGPELMTNALSKTAGAARSKALIAIVNSLANQHAQDHNSTNSR